MPVHLTAIDRVANHGVLRAVRQGMLCLIPAFLVSAAFLACSGIVRLAGGPASVVTATADIHDAIAELIPFLMCAAIGFMLAIRAHLPRVPVGALSAMLLVVCQTVLAADDPANAATMTPFVAIILPVLIVPILGWAYRQRWTRLSRDFLAEDTVMEALNLVVPGLLAAAATVVLAESMTAVSLPAMFTRLASSSSDSGGVWPGLALTGLNSLLWLGGIHGYHALQPAFASADHAVALNAAAVAAGHAPTHAVNSSFLGSFVFNGGSGGTAALIIAILLCCNNKSLRMLAWASIPIALLNVNETLLFGIPIIFSLRLGIPFLLVPLLNVAVGVLLTRVGVLHPAVISVPLNTPMFANSFIATDGQWLAPVLQLGITVLGAAVYAPFVRTFDRQVSDTSTIELRSLDTTYSRLSDDSSVRSTDPLLEARRALTLHRKQATVLEQLGDYNFCLHYQPQVSNRTGEMVSCEALLRARDACGNSVSPAQFIPWLEAAGLQSDVDLWVAKSAMAQYLEWQRDGIAQTISINLSGATMNDLVTLDTIIEIIEPAGGDISVEITEHALVENSDTVQRAITHLHEAGIKVIIDDFGTGYSALGYLHQYAIDGIKIDRSFVTAAATSRGLEVLRGLFHFADSLHLDLVVEGVETESQLKMLGDRNLVIQGWYYAAALCAEDLIRHWHRPWGSTP